MTFKERKELEIEAEDLSQKAFKIMDENKLAKDLWNLCNCSDNWAQIGYKLEDTDFEDNEKRNYFEEENIKAKKEFYELFLEIVKKYNK